MRPSQVLDYQGELMERLLDDNQFRLGNAAIIAAEVRSGQPEGDRDTEKRFEQERDAVANFLMDLCHRHVKASYAFRVTEEMVDLMSYAAVSLEDEDTWDPNLAPTGCGFVRFEKPVALAWVPGVRPATLLADWMVWGPGDDGRTILWFYADTHRAGEMYSHYIATTPGVQVKIREILGRFALVGWDSFRTGMSLGPPRLPLPGRALTEAEVEHLANTPYESARAGIPALVTAPEDAEDIQQANDARLAHALWLLLGQTITVLQDEHLERAAKRRAVRKGLPAQVTTIALRRAEHRPTEGEGVHVDWQYRWVVRGHWRWQACGDHHKDRKRIWVNSHVKGPEGKPFSTNERLYDLRR